MSENQTKSLKEKIVEELKSVAVAAVYFFCWFGGLMLIKVLLLREYQIEFFGFTAVVIGALVVAKVVLVLEYVPLSFTNKQPAWIEVLTRTLLYIGGVFIIMAIEKSFEARHEYGGVVNAFRNLANHPDIYHLWVNVICVSGALLFFNIWTVAKKHYGKGILWRMLISPLPGQKETRSAD